ncbi:MAG: hypothetical protein NC913_10200 [Candidatus Omnitrophica bacterium]|nr:hypothetical protein [Candidatus Omnitrophota bacterium]
MKKFFFIALMCFTFLFYAYCQQEKTISAFDVVEKAGARVQQIPDGESVKNVIGTFILTIKLNDSDYANLKSAGEKVFQKTISNPLKFEGKFITMLPVAGEKIERFMMAGKSELGNFYIYRNFDDITVLLPEIGIEIQDKISEIRKLSGNKVPQAPSEFVEGMGLLFSSVSFKTLFNQGKFWLYDAKVSTVEKAGTKLIELTKKEPSVDIKITVVPDIWTISEILLSADNATITANYKLPQSNKVTLIDYMPESIAIDAVDKGNTIKLELGSLTYNKISYENFFNLRRMKMSEFISLMAIKLMSQ